MSTEQFNHGLNLIAQHWPESTDALTISAHKISDLVPSDSGPTFIYDANIMRQQYEALKAAVGDFADIYYSGKANPRVEIISTFNALGAGAEIASVGEYRAARKAGVDPNRIIFAGPGKRQSELEEVISSGVGEIHIESFEEITRLGAIGTPIKASLRINPIAEAQGGAMRMGGKPTAFGFDEDQMDTVVEAVSRHANIHLAGVHVYGGTQILDAGTLVAQWKHSLDIAAKLGALLGRPLETIDLGGGLGIPYFDKDRPLDLEAIAAAIPALTEAKSANEMTRNARVIIEPGRFLVGPSGIYVAEVNSVKQSHGSTFVICEGGMHHHLAASGNLGQVVKRNYPIVAPAKLNQAHDQSVNLVGPLCTPLDTLGRNVALPTLAAGDLVAILQSGAYGLSASPAGFLSHPDARELLIDGDKLLSLKP
jgi:diaminopimelate decarboxylase